MNLGTYNILKGGAKRCHWQRLIEDHQVDLLFIQESYPHDEHLPPLLFPQHRGSSVWASAPPNKWGSGVFSSSGTLSRLNLPSYDGWVVGGLLRNAAWLPDCDEIHVFSLHAPPGEGRYPGQVNRILDEISEIAKGSDVIIAGDFNLTVSFCEDASIKSSNIAIHERLADEFGLMNCWSEANPGQPLAQTLRWSRDRTIPFHCDGIFVPQRWKPLLKSCVVLSGQEWEELSDHNPVIAHF